MEVWRHTLETAPVSGPFVVTLGTFDGVHAGHRELLRIAAGRAKALGHRAAVVTFDPHPTLVVAPQRKPKLLMTLEQRLAAFEAEGMDLAWVIPFSRAFSELSPEAFLDRILHILAPVELHVGRAFFIFVSAAAGLGVLTGLWLMVTSAYGFIRLASQRSIRQTAR